MYPLKLTRKRNDYFKFIFSQCQIGFWSIFSKTDSQRWFFLIRESTFQRKDPVWRWRWKNGQIFFLVTAYLKTHCALSICSPLSLSQILFLYILTALFSLFLISKPFTLSFTPITMPTLSHFFLYPFSQPSPPSSCSSYDCHYSSLLSSSSSWYSSRCSPAA